MIVLTEACVPELRSNLALRNRDALSGEVRGDAIACIERRREFIHPTGPDGYQEPRGGGGRGGRVHLSPPEFQHWEGATDLYGMDEGSWTHMGKDNSWWEEPFYPEVAQCKDRGRGVLSGRKRGRGCPATSGEASEEGKRARMSGKEVVKGKSKGKGKSQFHGQCYHCVERQKCCPNKDTPCDGIQKGRGGGTHLTPHALWTRRPSMRSKASVTSRVIPDGCSGFWGVRQPRETPQPPALDPWQPTHGACLETLPLARKP